MPFMTALQHYHPMARFVPSKSHHNPLHPTLPYNHLTSKCHPSQNPCQTI